MKFTAVMRRYKSGGALALAADPNIEWEPCPRFHIHGTVNSVAFGANSCPRTLTIPVTGSRSVPLGFATAHN